MTGQTQRKTTVIVAVGDSLSGVASWALRVRDSWPKDCAYDLRLLCSGAPRERGDQFDLYLASASELSVYLRTVCPAIVIPNYNWWMFEPAAEVIAEGHDLHCIGYCRADSEDEYYANLVHHAPVISRFLAVSTTCADTLAQRLPPRAGDVHTLTTGVVVPDDLARTYQNRPLRIIYAGRVIQHQKRVLDLVALVALLVDRAVDFRLTIVGEGGDLDALRDALSPEGDRDRVDFLGRLELPAMRDVLMAHDVLVQPSAFEGTSNSMLEAMALGTVPCVTRTRSGVDGIVQHGINGWLADVGDMRVMADAIAGLAADPAALEGAGRAAHETAKAFRIETQTRKLVEHLQAVSAMPPRTREAREYLVQRPSRTLEVVRGAVHQLLDASPRKVLRRLRRLLQG